MNMNRTGRKILTILAVLTLAAGTAAASAEAPAGAALEDKQLELGGSSIVYPSLTGMADETLQQEINRQMQEDLEIDGYLERMTILLTEENLNVRITWGGTLLGDVLSCVMSAEGALQNPRSTHRWTWSNIDLRDGHEITLEELFNDAESAQTALEEYLDFNVSPELSAHLNNSELTPLPDGFRLERTGLTLLYPISRLSTLRDRAGDIRIGWNEIRNELNLKEDGILERIGAKEMITLTAESAGRIRKMAESGALPDIPVRIGDGMKALTDQYHLLIDPDVYDGGRLFSLEGGCFRNVFLMTDYISESWDASTVKGIRMDRGCAWGLCVGETTQDEWREVLGEPEFAVSLDDEAAEAKRRESGSCDYYRFGDYQLQLYADVYGTLVSITLTE